jgi:hypothetical protein
MKRVIEDGYTCPACSEFHIDRDDARECCEEEKAYRCDVCEEVFDIQSMAEEHLEEMHPLEECVDAYGLLRVSKAELEAAGQSPLFK